MLVHFARQQVDDPQNFRLGETQGLGDNHFFTQGNLDRFGLVAPFIKKQKKQLDLNIVISMLFLSVDLTNYVTKEPTRSHHFYRFWLISLIQIMQSSGPVHEDIWSS